MNHITLCCLHDQLNNLVIHKLDNDQLFMVMNTGSVTLILHGNLVNKNTATGMLTLLSTMMMDVNQIVALVANHYVLSRSRSLRLIAYMYPGSNNFRKESLKLPSCRKHVLKVSLQ